MTHIPNIRYKKCRAFNKALRNKNKNKNIVRIGEHTIERIRSFFNVPSIQLNDLICAERRAKSQMRK
jgi:hypothetical protein